jgi:arylsulfatase A-like enzyme
VHVSNWLPTLCTLTGGGSKVQNLNIDGRNIWPLISGEQPDMETGPIYWKTPQAWAVRDGRWKIIVDQRSEKAELYDLVSDFRESEDLSEDNPEELERMLILLEEFKAGDRERD